MYMHCVITHLIATLFHPLHNSQCLSLTSINNIPKHSFKQGIIVLYDTYKGLVRLTEK